LGHPAECNAQKLYSVIQEALGKTLTVKEFSSKKNTYCPYAMPQVIHDYPCTLHFYDGHVAKVYSFMWILCNMTIVKIVSVWIYVH